MPLWHSVLINSLEIESACFQPGIGPSLVCSRAFYVIVKTSWPSLPALLPGGSKLASSDQGGHGDSHEEGQEEVRGDQREVTPEFQ